MAASKAEFAFTANHSFAGLATYLSFFNFKGQAFIIIKMGTYDSHRNLLTFSDVGSPTNDLQRFSISHIYFAKFQPVGIGMLYATKNVAGYNSFKASLYALKFGNAFYLKAEIGKQKTCFFRSG